MTKAEAKQYVRAHEDDDEMDAADIDAVFAALYDRPPDARDRQEGVWPHCCAAVM